MNLADIQNYLNDPQRLLFEVAVFTELRQLKIDAKSNKDEQLANQIWVIEQIFGIKKEYVQAFNLLQEKKYLDAWMLYEQIEIGLSFIKRHFNYENNEYGLKFIETKVKQFQKLFPYVHFLSRESIIEEETCSICGQKTTSPRNMCKHIVRNLYMGEMCSRTITKFTPIAFALTKHPFDKYTVLHPQDMEYNYGAIEMLMSKISSPYGRWRLLELKVKDKKYRGVGRNSNCPCESGKKYKKCCLGMEQELIPHTHIDIMEGEPFPMTPVEQIGTWK